MELRKLSTVTRLRIGRLSIHGSSSGGGELTYLSSVLSGLALGFTQPSVECTTADLSWEMKQPAREANHSPLPVPRLRLDGAVIHNAMRLHRVSVPLFALTVCKGKGKGVPLQAWSGPEGS